MKVQEHHVTYGPAEPENAWHPSLVTVSIEVTVLHEDEPQFGVLNGVHWQYSYNDETDLRFAYGRKDRENEWALLAIAARTYEGDEDGHPLKTQRYHVTADIPTAHVIHGDAHFGVGWSDIRGCPSRYTDLGTATPRVAATA